MSCLDAADLSQPNKFARTSASPTLSLARRASPRTSRSPSPPPPQASTPYEVHSPSPLPSSPGTALLSTVTGNDEFSTTSQVERARPEKRVSYYVLSLDEMLDKVLETEAFLFDELERQALKRIRALEYQARYLLIRLYLRKPAWIRVDSIGYENDIKDLHATCRSLCEPTGLATPVASSSSSAPNAKGKAKAPEHKPSPDAGVIDLTGTDDEDEDENDDLIVMDQMERDEGLDLRQICWDSDELTQRSPEVALGLLSMDELVSLGKGMKVNPGKGLRSDWTSALLRTSNQATLSFLSSASKGKENGDVKPLAAFGVSYDALGNKLKASSVVSRRALKSIGSVVHLHPSYRLLLDRLSLVFHRTSYTSGTSTTSFTANLLARFGKRHYPSYVVRRTYSIFPSRPLLTQYERALEVERRVEELLGEAGWGSSTAPIPSKAALAAEKAKTSEQRSRERDDGYERAIELFDKVEGTWRRLCKESEAEMKEEQEDKEKRLLYYRRRFHPGWPLTRVAYKSAGVLARLNQHDREVALLRSLLAQKSFRRGKRGDWWDRVALVLMRYPLGEEAKVTCPPKKKERLAKERKLEALQVCLDGLADPYTHLIYKSSLQRRILRIESSLDVPKDERRAFDVLLRKAEDRLMEGERLDEPTIGKKSIWRANDGSECSVEELALEQYVKEGWKGFHSENGILSTIFTLCFWDVLFADINGVFETEFQSAPLDLTSDAFAIVRRQMIDERLTAIEAGAAARFLSEADDRERPLETWAVGVNFAKFTKEELLEVVDCIGGPGLAVIATHFAEEYGHRTGGMPDLCLWNRSERVCKFAEVKGPGDKLSETQRVWIDVLLRAGLQVEVCRVVTTEEMDELNVLNAKKARRRNSSVTTKKSRSSVKRSDSEDD